MPRMSSFVPKRLRSETEDLAEPELKYFDSELASTSVVSSTTTWAGGEYPPATIGTLFCPVRGTGITNRLGRTVKLCSILLQGTIQVASQNAATVNTDNPTRVRLYLVQSRDANGLQTQAEDVIQSGTNILPLDMFPSLSHIGEYEILDSADIVMDNQNFFLVGGVGYYQTGFIRKFKFCHSFNLRSSTSVVNFKSDLGDYRDILDNSFTLIGISNTNEMLPTISYKCRVSFYDF